MQGTNQSMPPSSAPHNYASHPANPYVSVSPTLSGKGSVGTVSDQVNKFGKMLEEAAGGIWQHVKASPNIAETAWTKLAQGTKALTGGYESMFKQTFEVNPAREKLLDAFSCFLHTSAGPISGMLYISTERVAFSSDRPISYHHSPGQVTRAYYKVVVPLQMVKMVNALRNPNNQSEKYVQIVTIDGHEFWYLGFMNHERVLRVLHDAKNQKHP